MSEDQNGSLNVKWSSQTVLKLIDHFKNEECLYNTKHQLYHNKHARTDALDTLARKMSDTVPNITPTDIRTKLNYLRSQYGRELLKASESKKSGLGTDDIYVPSAYWFEHLHFIKDFVHVRKGQSNISYTLDDSSQPEIDDQPSSWKRKEFDNDSSLTETEDSTPAKRKKKSTSSDTDAVLKTASDYLRKLTENEKPQDKFTEGLTSFFSSSMLEITNKNLRDEVSSKIMLLIFDYIKKQRELDVAKEN